MNRLHSPTGASLFDRHPPHFSPAVHSTTEQPKLDAIRCHLDNLTLIFPETHREGMALGAMIAPNVPALVRLIVDRIKSESVPDTIPLTLRAGHYVGAGKVIALMDSLRQPGVVTVHGEAGIGKSAFVIEAVGRLVEKSDGAFSGGRLYIDLSKRMPLVVAPPFLGESAPPFEDLPRYSNSWVTDRILNTLQETMLKDIVSGLDKVPFEELPKLKTQARNLLAGRSVLVVLEGAENVPEAYIGEFLEPFGGNTHIAWLTRRKPNPGVQGLDGRPTHEVFPLSLEDSRELLCHHAGLDPVKLDYAASAGLDSIAHHAEFIPQFLVWAGRAIGHNNPATPTQIAKEIRQVAREIQADRLTEFTNPDRRDANARRFLESSLTRIQPALAATARRLFATLSAFHPAHGAPENLWALAAGLDIAQRTQQREFIAARRELLSLRLALLDEKQNAYPVHSLAAALAGALWREQPAEKRSAALVALCHAATAALKDPLPPNWFRDNVWIVGRTAEAAHYGHWVGEMEALASESQSTGPWAEASGITDNPSAADGLGVAWVEFLQEYARSQPLLALKEAAWTVVCRHYKLPFAIRPDSAHFQLVMFGYLCALGDVRAEREDWEGAEDAYKQAMAAVKMLADEHPDVPDYQENLAAAWDRQGRVSEARQEWAGAETAFNEAISIDKRLADANPDRVGFRVALFVLWNSLGDVRRSRADWAGAETAFKHAMAIIMKLVEENPDVPNFQAGLAVSWDRFGKVSEERKDWAGAEIAFNQATVISKRLATAHPDSAHFQRELSASFGCLGEFRELRLDWAGAEDAYKQAMVPVKKLADEHPDVPDFQEGLGVAWTRLGKVSEAREDLAGAEIAFKEAIAIDKRLADEHPEVARFQNALSVSWIHLGNICFARQEWVDAETAFQEAVAIDKRRADAHPDVVGFQRELSVSWQKLGRVHGERRDWDGAKKALNEALSIAKTLVQAHPDSADFQHVLAVSWERLATIAEESGDDAAAEQALRELLSVSDTLISRWPGVSVFEETATIAMLRLARLLERRGCAEEAATLNRGGLARVEQLASLLQVTGAEPTIQQKQIIAILPRSDEPETDAVAQ